MKLLLSTNNFTACNLFLIVGLLRLGEICGAGIFQDQILIKSIVGTIGCEIFLIQLNFITSHRTKNGNLLLHHDSCLYLWQVVSGNKATTQF